MIKKGKFMHCNGLYNKRLYITKNNGEKNGIRLAAVCELATPALPLTHEAHILKCLRGGEVR